MHGDDAEIVDVIQPRLSFPAPDGPVRFAFALAGLKVLVDVVDGTVEHALSHLANQGVTVAHDKGLLSFPIRQLPLLSKLPSQVSVDVDHLLYPLWLLITHRPLSAPAVVEKVMDELRLSWLTATMRFDELLLSESVPALLACEMPFVAAPEAWQVLSNASTLPVTVARARVGPGGYVEVTASKPQLVEAAPIPGMFRIDDTRFGVPLAYMDDVVKAPGFVFDAPRPRLAAPAALPDLPLAGPVRQTAAELSHRLAAFQAAILVAPAGGSRRVAAVAALAACSVESALVVCPPWALWSWRRAWLLAGFQAGLAEHDPIRLVTYRDLALGVALADAEAVVFDDASAISTELRRACARLDGLDAMRLVIADSWPDRPSEQVALAAHARPTEFRPDVPLALRYPSAPDQRLFEHLRPYLVRAGRTPGVFSRLWVDVSELPQPLRDAAARLPHSGLERVRALSELVSCGADSVVSPKLSVAIERARYASERSSRCVVLCRHPRFARLFAAALRPAQVVISDGDGPLPDAPLVVVVFDRRIPQLEGVDDVVVVDWPLSIQTLDAALPRPGDPAFPSLLVSHVRDTLDDRLAVRACVARNEAELRESELGWLLG